MERQQRGLTVRSFLLIIVALIVLAKLITSCGSDSAKTSGGGTTVERTQKTVPPKTTAPNTERNIQKTVPPQSPQPHPEPRPEPKPQPKPNPEPNPSSNSNDQQAPGANSRANGADCSTGVHNVPVVPGSKGDRDGDGIACES